jgi:hypothetical protein
VTQAGGLDVRPLRFPGDRMIDRTAVAGYLAKYATKYTEDTGHLSKRLRAETVDLYTDGSPRHAVAGGPACEGDLRPHDRDV